MSPRAKKSPSQVIVPEGYSYADLFPLIEATLRSNISVLLRGHPGVGKSSLAKELAAKMKLPLIDIRLAQRDPAELCGVYFPNREKSTLDLFPPEWVIKACREPCFVFLDEINAAVTKLHQSAAYQIVLEHRVGECRFHEGTVVMGAGNLEEDNAIVSPLSSALCNRFAHFIMRPDVNIWLEWGSRSGIHATVLAYIAHAGIDSLYNNNGEFAFPSPRTWEMASKVFHNAHEDDRKRAIASCVGPSEAESFFSYFRIFGKIDVPKIIHHGQEIAFNKGEKAEPSFIYAAIFAVASYICREDVIKDEDLPNIVKFLKSSGLNPEFVLIFLRQVNRNSKIIPRLKPLAAFQNLARELVSLQASLYV